MGFQFHRRFCFPFRFPVIPFSFPQLVGRVFTVVFIQTEQSFEEPLSRRFSSFLFPASCLSVPQTHVSFACIAYVWCKSHSELISYSHPLRFFSHQLWELPVLFYFFILISQRFPPFLSFLLFSSSFLLLSVEFYSILLLHTLTQHSYVFSTGSIVSGCSGDVGRRM